MRLWILLMASLSSVITYSNAQSKKAKSKNRYGLLVVQNSKQFQKTVSKDSLQAMVPLDKYLAPLHTNFVYATNNNFTHQVLYQHPNAFLRLEAALALQKVQDTLQSLGLDIKIFDAYRPYNVTEKMWEVVPDDRYAANPANGSGHNRGVAVDLTLVDFKTGKELAMPTGFDNFSDTAHHNFTQLSAEILQNRKLLKAVMEQYGFVALPTEWWHYSLPIPKRYDLLNFSFTELGKLSENKN